MTDTSLGTSSQPSAFGTLVEGDSCSFPTSLASCRVCPVHPQCDSVDHYLFCDAISVVARSPLRLDLAAVHDGGVVALLGRLGILGDSEHRLALHVDATLMMYTPWARRRLPAGMRSPPQRGRVAFLRSRASCGNAPPTG